MNNYTFDKIFKQGFLDNFTNNISILNVCITLLFVALLSLIVFFVYKLTTKNVIYSKKFNVTMALMSIVTAAVVLSMQANIVVSLGMVGALSIVRFRTAVKEPRDLLFLFWSISNGIIVGAGIYSVVLILNILLPAVMILLDMLPENKLPFILVVNCDDFKAEEVILQMLKNSKTKYKIKSRNVSEKRIDLVFEVLQNKNEDLVKKIASIENVREVNLLSQDGEGQF